MSERENDQTQENAAFESLLLWGWVHSKPQTLGQTHSAKLLNERSKMLTVIDLYFELLIYTILCFIEYLIDLNNFLCVLCSLMKVLILGD